MPEAARHLDEISHSHANLGYWLGTAAACVVGGLASWGLGAALAGMACIFPFGTIAAIAIGVVVGVAAIGPAADFVQSTGEAIGSTFTYVTGTLNAIGSANVLVNKKAAYRAHMAAVDFADCSDHPSPKHSPVIEGATSVWINGMRAARKGDAVDCDAKISSGSSNVIFGSPPVAIANKRSQEISDDERKYGGYARFAAELIGGAAAGVGKSLPCFLANVAVGLGIAAGASATGLSLPSFDYGNRAGNSFGTWIGNSLQGKPVHVPTGAKIIPFEDDVFLPGPLPLVWSRFYSSKDARVGILGQGWVTPDALELVFKNGQIHYMSAQGRELTFPDVAPGSKNYFASEQFQIVRTPGGHYIVAYPGDGMVYEFGPRHTHLEGERLALKVAADLHNNAIEYEHDEAGLLRGINSSNGHRLALHYSTDSPAHARLLKIERLSGAEPVVLVSYRYSDAGDLVEVIDREGLAVRSFSYENHMMVHQRFRSGLSCHYMWDELSPNGRVLRHWLDDGESYEFSYGAPDGNGNYAVRCVDQLQRVQHWTCNADKLVTSYTNALGECSEIEWNELQRMTRHTLPGGGEYRFIYDARGQLATLQDPLDRVVTLRWEDRLGRLSKLVGYDGQAWFYTYSDQGDLTEVTGPDGVSQSAVYDEAGLPVLVTDARGGVTRYGYNAQAQMASFTDCSRRSTHYYYNAEHELVQETDALNQSTRYQYSRSGQLQIVKLADGAEYRYGYDATGQMALVEDPVKQRTQFRYNPRGQLLDQQDAEGRRVVLVYDSAQRLSRLINENGASFEFIYDAADRVVEERRVGGSRVEIAYDANGWPVTVVQHPGIGDDDLELLRPKDAHPPAQPLRTDLVRDRAGRLIEKRCTDHHYRYRYDAQDRLLEAVKLRVLHDSGDQNSVTVATSVELRPLHTVRFEYDVLGNLIAETAIDEITGEQHSMRHVHDELGNRTQTFLPALDGQVDGLRALNYLHYGSGHLHQINLSQQHGEASPSHMLICDLERDALHREVARTQGQLATRFALDPLGRRMAAWCRPGSLAEPFATHDPAWRQAIESAGTSQARVLDGLMKEYSYDPVGELRQSRHSLQGVTGHRYDATGRIEETVRTPLPRARSAIGEAASNHERFAYDPAGNLLNAASSGNTLPERAPGYVRDNLVRVFEDKRYTYDGHGRLIRKKSGKHTEQLFEWDAEDRLLAVHTTRRPGTEHETTQATRFDYDALGRRVARHDAFGSTKFIWESMRLIEERRGARVVSYVYEPGSYVPLARLDARGGETDAGGLGIANDSSSCEIYYFHANQAGLPEELSNREGRLCWRASYRTWGATVSEQWELTALDGREALPVGQGSQPDIEQNLRFQGQYLDRDTGLHYNTFRFYDPDIGRFISPDPIGLAGGINLNGYVPNPSGWIDPLGWDWNYYLTNAKGEIYYHGRASDSQTLSDVMRRHGANVGKDGVARMKPGDTINRTTPVGTPKDVVRGIENSGTRTNGVLGRGGTSVRGNIDQGISDAKLKTDAGKRRVSLAVEEMSGRGANSAGELRPLQSKTMKPKTC